MKIFDWKFEGISFLTCESTETGGCMQCQQIVVTRGNLKLLIVNLRDNTGLCHYVTSVQYKFEFIRFLTCESTETGAIMQRVNKS